MAFFDEMKLTQLVDSLYLSPVCNLSPNPMIYWPARSRAGQISDESKSLSILVLLQIWPRESVRPMVFGSARTVWKLPTHLGPILRAVLRQMSLKLLTDITGKTVQVNTFLTFSWLNINFFKFFRLFLHSGISYSYFRNGWIQCILCIHTRITLYFISI